MRMSAEELERYARHLCLSEIGEDGQGRLRARGVLVIGAGGLGSPAALYLAAAGVGLLGIMDSDVVERGNLQRQLLHFTDDIGKFKVDSAAMKLQALNPNVKVKVYNERFSEANASGVLEGYDFIVDATDNFASKLLVANACHIANKPYSHAGILGFLGQTMTVHPGKSACYCCVFGMPRDDPEKVPRGPLGALTGVIGSIQATEAIKCLLGIGTPLINTLLVYESLGMTFRRVQVKRSVECPLCGNHSTNHKLLLEDK